MPLGPVTSLPSLSNDLADLVARAAPSVVGVEHSFGQGSGIVLAPDGWILTNAHVARGGGHLRVRLSGSRTARGELVGMDERTDLAVIRADARGLAALLLSERRLRVGELVVAIGNPLGFERSVTAGVVSALHRNLPAGRRGRGQVLEGLVQTDAAVNPGNSGGPLLDLWGHGVGVTTAMLPFASGIGFAVPAHTASWIASVLMSDGEVRRPFLGVTVRGEDLDEGDAREAGHGRGVRVLEVLAGSPADEAGLRAADLLVAVAGAPLETLDDLVRAMVLGHPVSLELSFLRDGSPGTARIRPRPGERAAA